MKIIRLSIGTTNTFSAPFIAIFTILLAHICCLVPLLIPLGFKGLGDVIGKVMIYKPWFIFFMLFMLGLNGWNLYNKPTVSPIAKISFWLSVFLVMFILINN